MGHWLAPPGSTMAVETVKRFDPRYWTVDFPRPMMASVVTIGPNALRVEAVFYKAPTILPGSYGRPRIAGITRS